jgi:hypothetical protein
MIEMRMLSNDVIEAAYLSLPEPERLILDAMAEKLETKIKILRGAHKAGFGRTMALEVLAKVGIWLNQNKPIQKSAI